MPTNILPGHAMAALARLRGLIPDRWRRDGVLGLPFTPDGHVVLVRHTYVAGWYPPGGGRRRGEAPDAAVERELREEIGLTSYSAIEPVTTDEPRLSVFLLRDVRYRPRRSLEIAEIVACDPTALPAGASPRLRRLLRMVGALPT